MAKKDEKSKETLKKAVEKKSPSDQEQIRREFAGLSTIDKAAIVMMLLGETYASGVVQLLEPKDITTLGRAMLNVQQSSEAILHLVLNEFLDRNSGLVNLSAGSSEYISKVLRTALGDESAENILEKIRPEVAKGLSMLKWMDARAIYESIQNEHPQVFAIVLSVLDHDVAGELLDLLPVDIRAEVISRIATLERVDPTALARLDDLLKSQFLKQKGVRFETLGGVKTAAMILNFSGAEIQSKVLKSVTESDIELAAALEENMFTFSNLIGLDAKSMQILLRDIENEQLIPALKGADETLKEKFLENMSDRAREILVDDLENTGPLRVTEVDEAQKAIASIARKLSEEGEIMLPGAGNDFV
jgi:flagellar motor switch protein FliG